jgi:hypothetical protein
MSMRDLISSSWVMARASGQCSVVSKQYSVLRKYAVEL